MKTPLRYHIQACSIAYVNNRAFAEEARALGYSAIAAAFEARAESFAAESRVASAGNDQLEEKLR